MRRSMVLIGLAFFSSCSCDDGEKVLGPQDDPPEPVMYTLRVNTSQGVSGTPSAGSYLHKSGTRVKFEYEPSSGFRNVVVETQSGLVGSTGTILLDRDTVDISVTVEKIPVVPTEAEPVKVAVESYLKAASNEEIISSYSAHVQKVNDLYTQYGPEEARQLALAAHRAAYESVSEELIAKAEIALSGQLFNTRGVVGGAVQSISLSSTISTSLIYVPGILSSVDAATLVAKDLELLVAEAGLASEVEVFHVQNPSAWYGPQRDRCVLQALARQSAGRLVLCEIGALLGDFAQAARQIGQIFNTFPAEAEAESVLLAKVTRGECARGRRVILLGHSQGNLMIEQALQLMGDEAKCVGVVSLAGPLGKASWSVSEPVISGTVLKGAIASDIILALGYNDFSPLESNLTRAADKKLDEWNQKYANTTVKIHFANRILEHVDLHFMTLSYLAGLESREWIKSAVVSQHQRLKTCECEVSPLSRIYAVSGQGTYPYSVSDLWTVVPHKNGADTLVGRIRTANGYQPTITDIALSPSGELWATSFDGIYRINKETVVAEAVAGYMPQQKEMNALAFSPSGYLYAANTSTDEVIGINLNPLAIFWSGRLGEGFTSSGDIVFHADGRLFASVRDRTRRQFFAQIDLVTGKASVIGTEELCRDNVWGLAFVGTELFGLTASSSGKGELVSIDISTGVCSVVRPLAFSTFGAGLKADW